MAKVAAINISEIRGIQKHEIPEAFLKEDWGIEGDAHAGNWHRQVSLLSTDSVKVMQDKLCGKYPGGRNGRSSSSRGNQIENRGSTDRSDSDRQRVS